MQEEFEKFLRERGIAEPLALFIPEYAEHKEQKVSLAPLLLVGPVLMRGCVGICEMAGERKRICRCLDLYLVS